MGKYRFVVLVFSVMLMALVPGEPTAQAYPVKPIRIVTAEPGGSIDFVARIVAQALTSGVDRQVIVDNRGGGVIPGETLTKSTPDGYTLLVTGSNFWIAPLLQKVPYDTVKDFAPISLVSRVTLVLVVHPSLPVKSVKELIALARTRPGTLNYASSSTGGTTHLAAELFKAMAGVNIVRIPYKGGGPALNDMLAGQVQVMFASAPVAAAQMKSGRLRGLAVTSAERFPLFPLLPTVTASGLPGFESVLNIGMYAPAATPAAIINRLHQEVVRSVNLPDVREKFFDIGVEPVGSSPQELASAMKAETGSMGKVIRDAGIRADR